MEEETFYDGQEKFYHYGPDLKENALVPRIIFWTDGEGYSNISWGTVSDKDVLNRGQVVFMEDSEVSSYQEGLYNDVTGVLSKGLNFDREGNFTDGYRNQNGFSIRLRQKAKTIH